MQNTLIMLSGLSGTGKSTAAEKLVSALGFHLVSLYEIRKSMGQKKYDRRKTPLAMERLYRDTAQAILQGNAIVDSVFLSAESRAYVFRIASECGTQIIILECCCCEREAKRRMRKRPKNQGVITEPRNPKVYDRLVRRKKPIVAEELPAHVSYITFDTEKNEIAEVRVTKAAEQIVQAVKDCLQKPI
jgi:predicted kinase